MAVVFLQWLCVFCCVIKSRYWVACYHIYLVLLFKNQRNVYRFLLRVLIISIIKLEITLPKIVSIRGITCVLFE